MRWTQKKAALEGSGSIFVKERVMKINYFISTIFLVTLYEFVSNE